MKFKGTVCTNIDSLSGVPFFLKIDPKIIHYHTDSTDLGRSDTARTHTHTTLGPKASSFHWVFSLFFFFATALLVFYEDPNWEINAEKSIGLKFGVQ